MKHADKKKIARKMRTRAEIKAKVPIFQTEAWNKRREARLKKQKVKELK